ncbi:MAG: hypothetical protein GY754_28410 [bacterium]|nr:hypothetical protein [bacterium]
MLYEIKNARNSEKNYRIRCFSDEYFSISVWFDENDSIAIFQLTYDKLHNSHALTWHNEKGFLHSRVDDGEIHGRRKMSPILVTNGEFPMLELARRFEYASSEIDPEVREFIYDKILNFREAG